MTVMNSEPLVPCVVSSASATPSSAVVFAPVVIPSVGRVWVAGVIVAPRALGGVELLLLPEGAEVSTAKDWCAGPHPAMDFVFRILT